MKTNFQKPSITATFRQKIIEWADITEVHGPRYIRHANNQCSKTFWALAFVVSFAGLAAQYSELLMTFIEQKSATKVYTENIGLQTEEMLQIIYCPADWLNFSAVHQDQQIDWPTLLYAVQFISTTFDTPTPVLKRIIELHTGDSSFDIYYCIPLKASLSIFSFQIPFLQTLTKVIQ